MRIGIASNDELSIAQHFGRTKGFVIAEIDNGKVVAKNFRRNTFSMHMQPGSHTHGEHGHSHGAILDALADCSVVLARGMGRRIYDDLNRAGIQAVITDHAEVDVAIDAYLAGTLKDNPEKGCVH